MLLFDLSLTIQSYFRPRQSTLSPPMPTQRINGGYRDPNAHNSHYQQQIRVF